jgi:NADPH:quinone reductase-like Zn-dependent oxidoreductase
MRAAVYHEHGGPEVVRIEELPRPEPGPGEVLLAVRAAALNHLDLWVRRGLPIETTMPHIGGSDIAGVVEALGAGVGAEWRDARVVVNPSLGCGRCEWCVQGEEPLCGRYRIIGEHTQGGFAEYVTVPAANLYRIPDGYDFDRAAAAPLVYLTAWRGLIRQAAVRPGETVLVTGASGGVATAAIQVALLAGARVYALTSTPWVERVRALGAELVLDRTQQDAGRALWEATGKRGVDVIFDSVGEALWRTWLRNLARGGRLVTYGATTGAVGETDIRLLFWKQLRLIGTTMANRAEFRAAMDQVFRGALEPVVDAVWPLERAAEAHARLEAGQAFGKLVLRP